MVGIPSIVQQAVAARLPSPDTALFRQGQVINALVLGQTPEGLTQIRIGTLTLTAQLPEVPLPGTVLQLAVRAAGSPPQLAILSQKPPGASPALPTTLGQLVLPASAPVSATPTPTTPIAQQSQSPVAESSGAESTMAAPARGVLAPVPNEATVRVALVPEEPHTPSPQSVTAGQAAPTTPHAAVASIPLAQRPAVRVMTAPPVVPGTALAVEGMTPAPLPIVRPLPAAAIVEPLSQSMPVAVPVAPAASTASFVPVATQTDGGRALAAKAVLAAPISSQAGALTESASPVPSPATTPLPTPPPARTALATAPTLEANVPSAQSGLPVSANPPLLAPATAPSPAPQPQLTQPASVPVTPEPSLAAPMAQAPADPAEALAQMIPAALSRQGSIGTLLQALAATAARGAILPEPVARAAAQVLAGRVTADGARLTGPILKAAIEQSGVLLEAGLAKSTPPGSDTKAALLELKSALSAWLGGDPGAVAPTRKAPPPVKGTVPRAQLPEMPVLPDAPRDLGRALHGHTEAALSRLKLLQLASLPEAGNATRPGGPELRLELPLMLGPELAMLQLQISRDGRRRDRAQQRGWTMRFALHSAATGEVGAEIALLGRAISVALWAAEPETARALEAGLPELGERLASIGLDAGAIRFRGGVPQTAAPSSGQLLERVS